MTHRILSEFEIKAVWEAITNGPGDDARKRALKLMLVTGQRPEAIAGLHRREITGQWWTIPPGRNTNRRPHRVYLTKLALEVIGVENHGHIFPATDGSNALSTKDLTLLVGGKKTGKKPYYGLDRWTPMDLRKSVMLHMSRLGISRETLAAVFGYYSKDPIGRLVMYDYSPEKKDALLLWETQLRQILGSRLSDLLIPMLELDRPTFGL